jgi:hypothetical protein
MKLDDDNFLIWQQQVLATVRGLNLGKYIHKDDVPVKYTSKEDETNCLVNEEFLNFKQQDQLLMAWRLASMFQSILTKMVGLTTSCQIWKRLEVYYAS